MSITTKRGDDGETDLMFGKKISKAAPRIEAYGTVDEVNSILGVIRHSGISERTTEIIDGVQSRLVGLMGELATLEEDLEKYDKKGYARIREGDVLWIEEIAGDLEKECDIKFKGWIRPGEGKMSGAYLDWGRSVCRRAERDLVFLQQEGDLSNRQSLLFLNRLSDLLWILGRYETLICS